MITIIRRHQRWLLLLVAILTIIAFAFLYNTTDTEQLSTGRVAEMYGRTVQRVDVDKALRTQQLAAILGLEEFLRDLSSTARSQEAVSEEFVWNLLVLRHQADALQVRADDGQLLDAIRSLPAFSQGGGFDRARYAEFLQSQLAPRGLTERHLEALVRDSLALRSIREMVGSPVQLGAGEEEELRTIFERIDARIFSLPALDAEKVPAPSDAEILAFFEENKGQMQTPPFRGAEIIKVELAEGESALEGREKVEALQRAADRISAIADAIAAGNTDLAALAKEHTAEILFPSPIDPQGNSRGESAAVPGKPSDLPPSVVSEIFRLSPERPFGEIQQAGDTFFIAHLLDEEPQRPMELVEVRERISEFLRRQAADAAGVEAAKALRERLLAAGADDAAILAAAKDAGAEVAEEKALEPWAQGFDERALRARAASDLKPGEIGEPQRGPSGTFLVRVDAREPAPQSLVAAQAAMMREQFLESKRSILLMEWFRVSREQANLRLFAN